MRLQDYVERLFFGSNLEDKLVAPSDISFSRDKTSACNSNKPNRSQKISFSDQQIKFPKGKAFKNKLERGKALHFFANHELLAIELFALALLRFPCLDSSIQKSIVSTIADEQKHLSLYINKMNEFGIEFGDFPLNDFLWRWGSQAESPEEFFAIMALTFEQANLDFCTYYKDIFLEYDESVVDILDIVYQDEINHVARGRKFLLASLQSSNDFWNYYCSLLPLGITPDRAKGICFDREARIKAGLDPQFIENLEHFSSGFSVTKRKQWKD